ncbi:MAG: bifunctional nuclease family protein [Planctomycetes bacterium]|nr:bifunctional nuclease family protein [Planctomycetota bacterium]
MEVKVELSKIIINETVAQQVVVLKEVNGERSFPIVIGMPEILAIDRRLKGVKFPRPMTHDLLGNVVNQVGGKVEKVVISDLNEHTFFAYIQIAVNGRVEKVDCRPSDGLALGVGLKVPFFVNDRVFEKLQS